MRSCALQCYVAIAKETCRVIGLRTQVRTTKDIHANEADVLGDRLECLWRMVMVLLENTQIKKLLGVCAERHVQLRVFLRNCTAQWVSLCGIARLGMFSSLRVAQLGMFLLVCFAELHSLRGFSLRDCTARDVLGLCVFSRNSALSSRRSRAHRDDLNLTARFVVRFRHACSFGA